MDTDLNNLGRELNKRWYKLYLSVRKEFSSRRLRRFDLLYRSHPVSDVYGFDRGLPIDRFYIEAFLQKHCFDIYGHVLEIQESCYSRKFGGSRVTKSDVLDRIPDNEHATIVGNLETGEGIPMNMFDCLIVTQVYQFIYNSKSAVMNSYRALKPGGVLLATIPGITKVPQPKMAATYNADCPRLWCFTKASAQRLFGDVFKPENLKVETHGSVLTACAFLLGLAAHELNTSELKFHDPSYELLITIRARKTVDTGTCVAGDKK